VSVHDHTDDGPLYVIDSSVWQRLPRSSEVRERLDGYSRLGTLCLVAPVILEIGFSAPTAAQWERAMGQVAAFQELPLSPQTRTAATRLQGLLWHADQVRSVGVFDTLTAAVALEHGAIVVHYDRDFEHLAEVCPELQQQWIVPAGSVD
jgi:predicted nucleic acid-binding protein